MPVKAVLFDFDGTLADTLPASFKAFRSVFEKYDRMSLTEERIVAMFGPTEEGILGKYLKNRFAFSEAVEQYYEVYKQSHADLVPDHPEMIELLAKLKKNDILIGVVTGKSDRAFQLSAEALKLKAFFDAAITGDDVKQPKPDPEGVLAALKQLGASPEEAVFVGDSNADIKAGKDAGVRTFAVQWLSVSQSTQYDVQPDGVFYRIQDFQDWLARTNSA
ncbi:HAD family hydrolase [Cohnella pontilimi]|nr:HAD family hydrolase [Cohnella pontilimi]